MKYNIGDEIILDNDLSYIVVDYFVVNNSEYLFLIGDKDKDLALSKLENEKIKKIEDEKEYEMIFNLLYERNKEQIEKILNEKTDN